jgi:hypothetical protein
MPSLKTKPIATKKPLRHGTSTSTATSPGEISSIAPSTTSASTALTVLGAPPTAIIPSVSGDFKPVDYLDYRGWHPKAGQLAAAPDAATELRSFPTFTALMGSTIAPATQYADEITTALAWTAQRISVEAYYGYVRSGEAVAWKKALVDLDQLKTVVQLVLANNPAALAGCPALVRMLEAPKAIAKRSHATLARNAKAKSKAAPAATSTNVTTESAAGPATTAETGATTSTGH